MIKNLSENIKKPNQPNKLEVLSFSLPETTAIDLFYHIKFWVLKNLGYSYLWETLDYHSLLTHKFFPSLEQALS